MEITSGKQLGRARRCEAVFFQRALVTGPAAKPSALKATSGEAEEQFPHLGPGEALSGRRLKVGMGEGGLRSPGLGDSPPPAVSHFGGSDRSDQSWEEGG